MKIFLLLFISVTFSFFFGCSSSERFTKKEETKVTLSGRDVRLLIDETVNEKELPVDSECYLFKEEEKIRLITPGETLNYSASKNMVSIKVNNKFYEGDYFQVIPADLNGFLYCNDMKLRGKLKIINNSGSVMVINTLDMESYLKGVIPREMPLGKGNENYEALKAFAICARTYTMQKMNLSTGQAGSKKYFDLYVDVRDQVYGGVEVEQPISNKAVDETRNLILTYEGKPAKVFYSSTCGGMTEDAKNIFGVDNAPYLSTIEDGNHPYCIISHAFNWREVYTPELFVERIMNNTDQYLLDSQDYELNDVKVLSRFESGRVNELSVELTEANAGEKKIITLKGNNIRWIIRTADSRSILKSIWFDVELDENKNVTITGKGYGHGVGLCQYGAIGQSRAGKNFQEILSHYFPGTVIKRLSERIPSGQD